MKTLIFTLVGFLLGGIIGALLMFGGAFLFGDVLKILHGEETWVFIVFHPFITAPIGGIVGFMIGRKKAKVNI